MNQPAMKISLETIPQTLARSDGEWHAADYFIASDTPLKLITTLLRPDYYCLFLCVEGSIRGEINDLSVALVPYCLTVVAPGAVIRVKEVSPYCKGRFLFFTRDFLLHNNITPSLLEALHYLGGQTGYCVHLGEQEAGILLKLYNILLEKRTEEETSYHREIIRTLFFTYIYEVAIAFKANGGLTSGINRYENLLEKFSGLLVKHNKSEHHLQFYADALFITPQYLIHAIKKSSGQTPGDLIDSAIVAEARLLLMDQQLRVADVAAELRFSEQAAFSKFFKKHTGLSPSAFRLTLVNKAGDPLKQDDQK